MHVTHLLNKLSAMYPVCQPPRAPEQAPCCTRPAGGQHICYLQGRLSPTQRPALYPPLHVPRSWTGTMLYQACRGLDTRPVVPKGPPRSITVEDSFRSASSLQAGGG